MKYYEGCCHINSLELPVSWLAADYLRAYDPTSAPNIIRAHLGHGSLEAGEEYRALCDSDVADREWKDIKKKIQSGRECPTFCV